MSAKKYLNPNYWRDYLNITLGLIAYAIGLVGFIKPAGVVTGGLTGVSLIVEYGTSGHIPLQYTYFAVNVILLLIAFKLIGVKFMVKTIYGVIILTFLITVLPKFITRPIVADEPLMSAIIGAMLCGGGIGFVFNANGSTGGTDIIVAVINKYRNVAFGRMLMYCDLVIIVFSYLVLHDAIKIVHGLIVLGVMTYAVDMVINGVRQSVQFLIFSEKYKIIADAINTELHRGCTVLDGTGWYSQKPSKVIVLLARRSEATQVFRMIRAIDENAFISQSVVRGVWGAGFDPLRAKKKIKIEKEQ
jgi:uncharacterized membrane-anchored protein YitT (DUF2179 family)